MSLSRTHNSKLWLSRQNICTFCTQSIPRNICSIVNGNGGNGKMKISRTRTSQVKRELKGKERWATGTRKIYGNWKSHRKPRVLEHEVFRCHVKAQVQQCIFSICSCWAWDFIGGQICCRFQNAVRSKSLFRPWQESIWAEWRSLTRLSRPSTKLQRPWQCSSTCHFFFLLFPDWQCWRGFRIVTRQALEVFKALEDQEQNDKPVCYSRVFDYPPLNILVWVNTSHS